MKNLVCAESVLPVLSVVFPTHFLMVESLNFSNCGIDSWEALSCLGTLPHLSTLKLCQNPLSRIALPTCDTFIPLKQLNLEDTAVGRLSDLTALDRFPSLINLRISNTPLTQRFNDHSRMILISYLPKITHLNGSKLDSKERLGAERSFIREFSADSGSNQHATLDTSAEVPSLVHALLPEEVEINAETFARLISQHGQVLKFANVSLAPPTEATLHLQTEEGEQATARLPLKAKVKDLKQTCESLFGIPVEQMKVFYGDHEMMAVLGLEVLRFENKTLGSVGMKDDDIIVVARKDSS